MRADEALRVLGLSAPATPNEIKSAFRQRVKANHPDRYGRDPRRRQAADQELRRIIEAYQCLQSAPAPEAPRPAPQEDNAGASMFSIHQETAPTDRGRRAPYRAGRRRGRNRRGRLVGWAALSVLAVVSFAAWVLLSLDYTALEGTDFVPLPSVEERATLADRAACYSTWSDEYTRCLVDRMTARDYGLDSYKPPEPTASRLALCRTLQSHFSQQAYDACIAELRQQRNGQPADHGKSESYSLHRAAA